MNAFLQKKSTQIILLVISVIFAVNCLYGFVGMARHEHVKYVAREVGAAVDQLNKNEPGIERAEMFVARLRKIDTDGVPADVKQALQDYISAVQQSIDALKAGRNTEQLDPLIAQAKQRFVVSIEKCE